MTQEEVAALMSSSKNETEWNANADKVKAAFGGDYPDFWYGLIIMSGLINRTLGPGSDEIKITAL